MKKYSFKSELIDLPFLNRMATNTRIELAEKHLKLIANVNREDLKVLEVGSGNRILTKELRLKGFSVVDIDLNNPDAQYRMDAREMHFFDNSFDAVIAFEVLEHCNCIKEILRVLKPKGILIVTIPKKEGKWLVDLLVKLNLVECYELHSEFIELNGLASPELELIYSKKLFLGLTEFGVFKKK